MPRIEIEEFRTRQAQFASECRQLGLDAAIVWSRGGTSHEFYGDVLYLTNHHTQVQSVEVRDMEGWRSHGMAAVVVFSDAHTVLFTDGEFSEADTAADQVRPSTDLPRSIAELLAAYQLDSNRVGLAGRDSLLAVHLDSLRTALAGTIELVPCDAILQGMRAVKSPAELAMLRHAANVGVGWMKASMEAAVAGQTEGQIVGAGLGYLAAHGGGLYDVAIAGGSRSDQYWGSSGIPHWDVATPLQKGDLLHVDNWGPVDGYYTDIARSTVIGGKPTPEQRRVLEGSVSLVEYVIEGVRPGVTPEELLARRAVWLSENGLEPPPRPGEVTTGSSGAPGGWRRRWPGGVGHSVGLAVETPFLVYGDHATLQPNMVMAVETHFSVPGVGASNFEQNLIVTADGCELITADLPSRWWE